MSHPRPPYAILSPLMDDLSVAESVIEARLFASSAETDGAVTRETRASKAASRSESKSRRRKRSRATLPLADDDVGLMEVAAAGRAERMRAGEDANRAALDRLLVRPRVGGAAAASGAPRLVEGSVVVAGGGDDFQAVRESRKAKGSGEGAGEGKGSGAIVSSSSFAFVEKFRREVGEVGAAALGKKDKKMFEARRRAELGMKEVKPQTMPLPMLVGVRKKQKERETKAKELALASGMLIKSKRKNK